MALAGQGHEVTLAYLPYANWQKPMNSLRSAPPERLCQQRAAGSWSPWSGRFHCWMPGCRRQPAGCAGAGSRRSKLCAMCSTPCRSKMSTGKASCTACAWSATARLLQRSSHWLQANRPDVVVTPNGRSWRWACVPGGALPGYPGRDLRVRRTARPHLAGTEPAK